MAFHVPFGTSDQFCALPANVQAKFIEEDNSFKSRLLKTDLYSYFLTDEHRGPDVIRAYLETNKFQLFSDEDRLCGAAYFGFCYIFKVYMTF